MNAGGLTQLGETGGGEVAVERETSVIRSRRIITCCRATRDIRHIPYSDVDVSHSAGGTGRTLSVLGVTVWTFPGRAR